ncbi:MAG: hypothetical protein ACJ74E_07495 [Actinomycetes bacterium]
MDGVCQWRHFLTRGQVVTLLVGIGVDLRRRHAAGTAFGPVHPSHVTVDDAGRPSLRDAVAPPGWTPHDDWVGLLRFGRFMGRTDESAELSWWSTGQLDDVELLRWLMNWAKAEPLPRLG